MRNDFHARAAEENLGSGKYFSGVEKNKLVRGRSL
jgi:hypothetical protein